MDTAALSTLAGTVPRPDGVTLTYGTAGFRAKAEILPSTFLRMGMLATLRSLHTGKAVGVMITASHNPVQDNGIKMVDPDGGMLEAKWETYACDLANAPEAEVGAAVEAIAAAESITLSPGGTVYVGRDTRPSSESLCALVKQSAAAMGATVNDIGLVTTPQLHHVVRMMNLGGSFASDWGNEEGYYAMLAAAYKDILQGVDPAPASRGRVVFDGAGGIGAPKLTALQPHMAGLVDMEIRNGVGAPGLELNKDCGAEHVQKKRLPPVGVAADMDKGLRLASVDGDADRLVYHYFDAEKGDWNLLDGDKIAALAASFLADNLRALGATITSGDTAADAGSGSGAGSSDGLTVSVGCVQTAYANGASSKYIRETLGMPVPLAKTGVKYVHHKALEYDLGVYFEANGHGTVVFQDRLLTRLRAIDASTLSPEAATALARLLAAAQLINQAVGDAISDAMFIEAVLTIKGWTIGDWDAMYADLPSRQTKLAVKDRTAIITTEDETRVVEPAALQAAIDDLVGGVESGRAFVRPSGTEDVVRVYAEAATSEAADGLALAVAQAAHRLAGGTGEAPTGV